MCIFTSVARVRETAILAAAAKVSPEETRVVIAYQMRAEFAQQNAMILPVRGFDLKVHDGESVASTIKTLLQMSAPRTRSRGLTPKSLIPVERVGSYDVSIAPTVEDIHRLDPALFSGTLRPETLQAQLAAHYLSQEQFLVARLVGTEKFRPLLYEYSTRDPRVVIPLLHLHEGDSIPFMEDFDHDIFILTNDDYKLGDPTRPSMRSFTGSSLIDIRQTIEKQGGPLADLVQGWTSMRVRHLGMHGSLTNQDLLFSA